MADKPKQRVIHKATPEERQRMSKQRELIDQELPDLIERDRRARTASEEQTLSGALRRAIHSHDWPLTKIAAGAGIDVIQLSDFLAGDQTLPSDVMDKLAALLGCEIKQAG